MGCHRRYRPGRIYLIINKDFFHNMFWHFSYTYTWLDAIACCSLTKVWWAVSKVFVFLHNYVDCPHRPFASACRQYLQHKSFFPNFVHKKSIQKTLFPTLIYYAKSWMKSQICYLFIMSKPEWFSEQNLNSSLVLLLLCKWNLVLNCDSTIADRSFVPGNRGKRNSCKFFRPRLSTLAPTRRRRQRGARSVGAAPPSSNNENNLWLVIIYLHS